MDHNKFEVKVITNGEERVLYTVVASLANGDTFSKYRPAIRIISHYFSNDVVTKAHIAAVEQDAIERTATIEFDDVGEAMLYARDWALEEARRIHEVMGQAADTIRDNLANPKPPKPLFHYPDPPPIHPPFEIPIDGLLMVDGKCTHCPIPSTYDSGADGNTLDKQMLDDAKNLMCPPRSERIEFNRLRFSPFPIFGRWSAIPSPGDGGGGYCAGDFGEDDETDE